MGCCEYFLTCDIAFNAVMPLSRASTRRRYSRIEGVTDVSSSDGSLDSSDINSESLPTASNPRPTDNVEVLSQWAPRLGEIVLEAPQGDLPDSRRKGSKAPKVGEGSDYQLVTHSMRLYLLHVEARLRGITALKAMSQVR